MNEANLDHLLQVTAPRSSWGQAGPGVGREDRPAFDNHLAQATSPRVPAEPVRAWQPPVAEAKPPADDDATTDVTIGTDSRTGGESEIESRHESRPPDANQASENSKSDATTTATDRADVAAEDGKAEQTDEGDSNQEESDGEATDAANAAAAAEAAAAFVITAQATRDTELIDEVAITSEAGGPTELHVDATSEPNEQSPKDGEQTLQKAENTSESGSDVRTESEFKAEGEIAATVDKISRIARHESIADPSAARKAGNLSTSQSAKAEQQAEASQRPRGRERETPATDDAPASEGGQDSTATTSQSEPVAKNAEQTIDSPRDAADKRTFATHHASRGESPTATGRTPSVAAAPAQPTETATESPKPEPTDEKAQPAATHNTRSDAPLQSLARLSRHGMAAARGPRDASAEEAPRVDPTRFVNRVAKAFHTAQERGGALQLRLSPPELGALRLELLVHDGVLAAKLEAETPAARRVLLDHLPILRDRLAEQNIRVERFDVDVRQEGGGNSPASPREHRQQQPQHGTPHRQPSRAAATPIDPIVATPTIMTPATNSQINLVA